MSLSSDLTMLSEQLQQRVDAQGELRLSPCIVRIALFILQDAIRLSRQMEANAVRRDPVEIDLSDPKIELFPKARLPAVVPFHKPDDGGAA